MTKEQLIKKYEQKINNMMITEEEAEEMSAEEFEWNEHQQYLYTQFINDINNIKGD